MVMLMQASAAAAAAVSGNGSAAAAAATSAGGASAAAATAATSEILQLSTSSLPSLCDTCLASYLGRMEKNYHVSLHNATQRLPGLEVQILHGPARSSSISTEGYRGINSSSAPAGADGQMSTLVKHLEACRG